MNIYKVHVLIIINIANVHTTTYLLPSRDIHTLFSLGSVQLAVVTMLHVLSHCRVVQ